jgi:hypothetical protein
MTWEKRTVEFPNHPIDMMDVLDILTGLLDKKEIEEFAEQLLAFRRPAKTLFDEFAFVEDD